MVSIRSDTLNCVAHTYVHFKACFTLILNMDRTVSYMFANQNIVAHVYERLYLWGIYQIFLCKDYLANAVAIYAICWYCHME